MNESQRCLFLDRSTGWIDMELINLIFPNCEFVVGTGFGTLGHVCQAQWKFLQRCRNSKIRHILVPMAKYGRYSVLSELDQLIVKAYASLFSDIGWTMKYEAFGVSTMQQKDFSWMYSLQARGEYGVILAVLGCAPTVFRFLTHKHLSFSIKIK